MSELENRLNLILAEKTNKIVAENIKVGVNIYNVEGTYTSDANANVGDILLNKTAYVNGQKLVGNMSEIGQQIIIPNTNRQNILQGYHNGAGYVEAIPDESPSITNQDNLLNTQNITINQLYQAINNKIALDLVNATSDANATAEDIMENKTAYVNGVKIFGNKTDKFVVQNGMKFGYSNYIYNNGNNWDISNVLDMSHLFQWCENINRLDVANWNVGNVNNMVYTFAGCSNITDIDISNWDVSNVQNMFGMFYNDNNIVNLDVSNWNVSNVQNMSVMFQSCANLVDLDISNWDVHNVNNTAYMFMSCINLVNIDVSNWQLVDSFGNSVYIAGMFTACNNLSDNSIDSIINMLLNLQYVSPIKNVNVNYFGSPFNGSNITSSNVYNNRKNELYSAGWRL